MPQKKKVVTRRARETASAPAPVAQPHAIRIRVNGSWHTFKLEGDLSTASTLAYLLREKLGFTGLKVSCDEGACGACTVIQDGKAVLSCMVLAVEADGHEVLTIEGLPKDDPVVEAFAEQSEPGYGTAMQCGYCTPGFVYYLPGLLEREPGPHARRGEGCPVGQHLPLRLLRRYRPVGAGLRASQKIQARRSGT